MAPEKNANDVYTVVKTTADLLGDPGNGLHIIGRRDSQLLYGEEFQVLGKNGGYLHGRSLVDGYEGHIHQSALEPKTLNTTHVVAVPLAHIYGEPDFKTRPLMVLSFMSRVTTEAKSTQDGFIKISGDKGWVFESEIAALDDHHTDIVHTAETFLHTPYLYGGRSALGIDCSALVQLSLLRAGIPCKRDTDQQTDIGKDVAQKDIDRGDIVFFKGHVGIMIDKKRILNATARRMQTCIENLSHVAESYGGITAVKRVTV
jgi:cell wall-associated NlpC family hydrolase